MKRVHLFEFIDLTWYPAAFRRMQTDYLQYVGTRGSGQRELVPWMIQAMQHAGTHAVIDLCSGGSGPWLRLQEQFRQAGWPVRVTLTDKYPDPAAARKWPAAARAEIEYLDEPVDAMNVPAHLTGMRTLFEGFHHFQPEAARAILRDALEKRAAIGVFEIHLKPWIAPLMLITAPLSTLIGYLVLTPFIRPRTWQRFLFTYLIPVVPLATCWDGVVSMLRVYSPEALAELTAPLQAPGYTWEMGQADTGTPVFEYTYLVGYPSPALAAPG